MLIRRATSDDAERIAALHADSWRRFYRGAYSDAFLDGDVVADRHAVWASRLAVPTETVVAERGTDLLGFVHVVLDDDPRWGSLVDNLHVMHDVRRTGIGTRLLGEAATAVAERAASPAMYLWVLEQNNDAQRFYVRCGATRSELAGVDAPGGDPTRLDGTRTNSA
ncbi:GNAT family N-acetyltransferase [Cryptosporangium sp. NPDC048952]|uniref:GNAT family N-acetyltransferase n=1 Tax=Cryptosporangium sp. NPDC048952 TaxID=3363961 RepID=UPI003715B7F1